MKNTLEIVCHIERELKMLALEDLSVQDSDSEREKRYKHIQIGKQIALEKTLEIIRGIHNTEAIPVRSIHSSHKQRKVGPVKVCQ